MQIVSRLATFGATASPAALRTLGSFNATAASLALQPKLGTFLGSAWSMGAILSLGLVFQGLCAGFAICTCQITTYRSRMLCNAISLLLLGLACFLVVGNVLSIGLHVGLVLPDLEEANSSTAHIAVCLILAFQSAGVVLQVAQLLRLQRAVNVVKPEKLRQVTARVLPYPPVQNQTPPAALAAMRIGCAVYLRSIHTTGVKTSFEAFGGGVGEGVGVGGESAREEDDHKRRTSSGSKSVKAFLHKKHGGGGDGGAGGDGGGPSKKSKEDAEEYEAAYLQLAEDGTTLRWGWHSFLDLEELNALRFAQRETLEAPSTGGGKAGGGGTGGGTSGSTGDMASVAAAASSASFATVGRADAAAPEASLKATRSVKFVQHDASDIEAGGGGLRSVGGGARQSAGAGAGDAGVYEDAMTAHYQSMQLQLSMHPRLRWMDAV